MDAQPTRPHDHHQQGGIHTGMEEGHAHEEEAHGMKGMLKKVKRKAKKVKDSLTGHGGHQEQDRDVPDDRDLDEEEDDDEDEEEVVQDPAVHGASGHEAAVTAGLASGHTGKSAAMPQGYSGGGDPMKMSPMAAEQDRAGGRGGHHKLTDITEEPRVPLSSPMTHGMSDQHPKGNDQLRATSVLDTDQHPKASDQTRATPTVDRADRHPKGADQMRDASTLNTSITTDQHTKGGDQMQARSVFDTPMTTTTDQRTKGDDQMQARSAFDTPMMTTTDQRTKGGDESARTFVGQQEKGRGHPQVTFDEPLEEDPHGLKDRRPPPNYESKTVDRSGLGGEEADVGHLADSLGKAHISSGGETKRSDSPWEEDLSNRNRGTASVLPTGSHDQFSPEATHPQPISTFDGPKHGDKLQVHDDDHHPSTESPQNQSSYAGKITSALTGTAVSAKDAVASKLGYGGGEKRNEDEKFQISDPADEERHRPTADQTQRDQSTHTGGTIYDKAASAKNVVASKLGYDAGGNRTEDQTQIYNSAAGDHHPRDHSTIGQPQQNQSSYTDTISSAASAVAGTATSAKNAVASKLGYGSGERNEDQTPIDNPTAGDNRHHSTIDQPPQNQSKIADAAENTVASKRDQPQTDNRAADDHLHETQQSQSSYTDKISAAASAIASKLGYGGHEQQEGSQEGASAKKPTGVVTESEELKKRLGTGSKEEEMEVEDSSVKVPETGGVVGRMMKGAVESLFGTGDNSDGNDGRPTVDHRRPSSGQAVGSSTGTEGLTESGNAAGGRAVQGSGN